MSQVILAKLSSSLDIWDLLNVNSRIPFAETSSLNIFEKKFGISMVEKAVIYWFYLLNNLNKRFLNNGIQTHN